jgi:hypothetical protein
VRLTNLYCEPLRELGGGKMLASRKSALLLLSLSLILFAATVQTSQAVDYTKVGVKVGDTADYSVTSQGGGTGFQNGTMHLEVKSVSGTIVSVDLSGTGIVSGTTVTGNISTGSGSIFPYLIASGLTAGDPLYSGSSISITTTATKSLGGQSRTLNELTYGFSFPVTGSYDLDWDRATGLMVEFNMTISSVSASIILTSTSLWSAGLFGLSTTTLLIIGIGAVVIVGIAVALKRRR